MDQVLNVLLFTNNSLTSQSFISYVKKQEDFHLVAAIDNTDCIHDITLSQDVNILILDLEDENQGDDVIQLIDSFYMYPHSHKPYILVISNVCNNDILDKLHDAGADFIISRNKPDYSVQLVFDLLRLIHEKPKTPCRSHHDYYPRMLHIIYDELDKVGINHCHVGYNYLAEAILLFLDGKYVHLYSTVGDLHGKSSLSVTRAMQNAINHAWQQKPESSSAQKEYPKVTLYPSTNKQSYRTIPTTKEFIHCCANRIRRM